jgi:hypothetical protein
MRKGYLLTALAAVVLLAASPGTAAAQNMTGVTITGPSNNTVNEGGTATYTVAVRGYVDAAADAMNPTAANTVTVTLATPVTADSPSGATDGDAADLNSNAHVLSVSFNTPTNSSTTNPLLFTDSKTISVATLHDNDAEDEHFTLAFTLTADGGLDTAADNNTAIALAAMGRYNPSQLIIDDDEMQGYTLTLGPGQTPTEGSPFTVNLRASPAHEDGSGTLQVNIDKPSGWTVNVAGDNPTTVDSTNPTRAITITQTAGDRNRVTDTVTVSAHTGVVGASKEQASLSIDVADANALQAVTAKVVDSDGVVLKMQPTSVEEGQSVKIAVMPVDKDGKVTTANEALEIALAPSGSADARDYRLSAPIKITAGQSKSNLVDLMAETDEDVGPETLVFDATVSGEAANGTETKAVAGVLSIGIDDATAKKIWPPSEADAQAVVDAAVKAGAGDEGLNPGESFAVKMSDLFTVSAGYTATYAVGATGDAVIYSASGDSVTVTAEKAGDATVTVTGTAKAAMAAATVSTDQTVSNSADVTFGVTVVDKKLVVTLEAPDGVMDGNIVEGKSYDIKVMANRAVTEGEGSVEVEIKRDRAASDAGDADFTVSSAKIMAGEDSATAELMVTEDNEPDAGHASGEQLVLYGEVNGEQTNSLTFTIWDEAVPALPLIAQVLLSLLLMAGGTRLYRRRQG